MDQIGPKNVCTFKRMLQIYSIYILYITFSIYFIYINYILVIYSQVIFLPKRVYQTPWDFPFRYLCHVRHRVDLGPRCFLPAAEF